MIRAICVTSGPGESFLHGFLRPIKGWHAAGTGDCGSDCVPLIGPAQFAAYAAVTAAVSILNFLNLGMGGALVTPLAQAAADNDRHREASLVRSGLLPIVALAIAGLAVALPVLSVLPMRTVFGLAATATSGRALRTAAILACIGTFVAVPLSVVESVRQAYQELHVNNLLNALINAVLCTGLLLIAWLHPTLPAFVAVTAFHAAPRPRSQRHASFPRASVSIVHARAWFVAANADSRAGRTELHGRRGCSICVAVQLAGLLHGAHSCSAKVPNLPFFFNSSYSLYFLAQVSRCRFGGPLRTRLHARTTPG